MLAVWTTSTVISLGTAIGAFLVLLDHLLISRLFRPLGYKLCGVLASKDICERLDRDYILHAKVPVWLESGLIHLFEIFFCFYYAWQWTWWRDFASWPQDALMVKDVANDLGHAQERDEIAPFYLFYFGYVSFSFVRDVFLNADRTGGNIMFTIHHVITYGLVVCSFHYGEWRSGFLTRLLLGLGEVTLYLGKTYGAREQVGNGSRRALGCIFLLNFIVWGGMRCIGYAYLCYSLTAMYIREHRNWTTGQLGACTAMLIGSWAMLCLQIIWTPFILKAGMKYLTTGKMEDQIHRDARRTSLKSTQMPIPGCLPVSCVTTRRRGDNTAESLGPNPDSLTEAY